MAFFADVVNIKPQNILLVCKIANADNDQHFVMLLTADIPLLIRPFLCLNMIWC